MMQSRSKRFGIYCHWDGVDVGDRPAPTGEGKHIFCCDACKQAHYRATKKATKRPKKSVTQIKPAKDLADRPRRKQSNKVETRLQGLSSKRSARVRSARSNKKAKAKCKVEGKK